MEDLVERLARGNVTEVKVVLTSVVLALAAYQLVLIAVGYGKLRCAEGRRDPLVARRRALSARARDHGLRPAGRHVA